MERAQMMEAVFPTYDLYGQKVTAVHSHYRMLTSGCTAIFTGPSCQGGCYSCGGKIATSKCKARQLECRGNSVVGLKFPFSEWCFYFFWFIFILDD